MNYIDYIAATYMKTFPLMGIILIFSLIGCLCGFFTFIMAEHSCYENNWGTMGIMVLVIFVICTLASLGLESFHCAAYEKAVAEHYEDYKNYIVDTDFDNKKVILMKDDQFYTIKAYTTDTIASDYDHTEITIDENNHLKIIQYVVDNAGRTAEETPLVVN